MTLMNPAVQMLHGNWAPAMGLLLLVCIIVPVIVHLTRRHEHHKYQRDIARRNYRRLQGMVGEGANGRRLNYLRNIDPFVFEELILYAMESRGYKVIRNSRYTGDGGIDGQVIIEGVRIPIQAKRYSFHIKQRHVREFSELVKQKNKPFGIFVHTGRTGRGSSSSNYPNVQMVSGNRLIRLLSEPEAGEAPMFTLKYQVTGTITKRTAKEGGHEDKEQ